MTLPTPAQAELRIDATRAVEDTIAEAARRNERGVAAARALFFAALLTRLLATTDPASVKTLLTGTPLAVGIAFSAAVLGLLRRPPRRSLFWIASVTVDSAAAFAALLPNALWPAGEYLGITHIPDTIGLVIVVLASGFRLSRAAVVWAAVANVVSFVALVAVDRAVSGPRFTTSVDSVTMFLIYLMAAAMLAYLVAWSTRRLVRRGALAAVRAETARQGLGSVLAASHDIRSVVAAVSLQSDTLASELESSDAAAARALQPAAHQLADEVARLRRMVAGVSGKALGGLGAVEGPAAVELGPVLARVVEQARRGYPEVSIETPAVAGDLRVAVAGGADTLGRMLQNLVHNACEGDGVRHPTRVAVAVEVREDRGRAYARIRDDGPGLPADSGAPPKPGGLGVGLTVVRGLVEASGGTLRLGSLAEGGTEATLGLRLAVVGDRGTLEG